MPFTDYGLIQLGSFTKGDSPSYPSFTEFGQGSLSFDGTQNYLENGFLRKAITWRWNGTKPQGTAILLTTDGNGSTINELGIGVGSIVGSNLYNRELSAIGDKNESFTVTLTFDVDYRRP